MTVNLIVGLIALPIVIFFIVRAVRTRTHLCAHCGKATEDGAAFHEDCLQLRRDGWTDQQITAMREGRADPGAQVAFGAKPLTAVSIFWAVFFALWAFGITSGIAWSIIQAILHS